MAFASNQEHALLHNLEQTEVKMKIRIKIFLYTYHTVENTGRKKIEFSYLEFRIFGREKLGK